MTKAPSRFDALAQAVRSGTAEPAHNDRPDPTRRTAAAGLHQPAVALIAAGEGLREHIARLEVELARKDSMNAGLEVELERAKRLSLQAGANIDEFVFLDADSITDPLPKDRIHGGAKGREFEELLADIDKNGQNDAITVRRTAEGNFEIAAGRRRLEACRQLGRSVLARIRDLDEPAMLRIQYSENERRTDISALERARWFSEVKNRLNASSKDIAAQFDVDPSTFSLYLRLARFPDEILDRLDEPRRLAVLPARRVMEALERDDGALQRIIGALDVHRRSVHENQVPSDPADQIEILMRVAEGRGDGRSTPRTPVPDRRHIVRQGQRIGTLTRNGGQWVFRFATSIPDNVVHLLTERLALPVSEANDSLANKED
jgi:ParB family chromosome partitioning protein